MIAKPYAEQLFDFKIMDGGKNVVCLHAKRPACRQTYFIFNVTVYAHALHLIHCEQRRKIWWHEGVDFIKGPNLQTPSYNKLLNLQRKRGKKKNFKTR